MSGRLEIGLLGAFRLVYDGRLVATLNAPRPQSLLAYLLLHRRAPQSRQHLAYLLWPDTGEGQARSNLRNLLHTLRHALPDADRFLDVAPLTLQWRPDAPYTLDVAQYEEAVAAARRAGEASRARPWLEQAVSLYQGELLPGLYDEWLLALREELRQQYLQALGQLSRVAAQAGDYRAALQHGQRLLQQEPLSESAYVALMRLHALSGDRAGVQRVYRQCEATLARELGVTPAPATQAAYQQLLQSEGASPPDDPGSPFSEPVARPRPLPIPATPFIGREDELAELARLLLDPDCRLLTILGPGGMGKSRLALQTAAGHASVYADGVAYASLTPLRAADLIVPTLAESLNFTFAGPAEPAWQLLNFLRHKEMLLVLDNFEHLLDGAPLLVDILTQAPGIQFLLTSRQRLDLQQEWVFEIEGLPPPAALTDQALAGNSAVQLFLQSARRIRRHFALTEANRAPVARICHLVGGMPLGLELAASWVRSLSCAEIAGEIERGLDFLAVSTRNMPARHRSLRAVFDHSWRLLSPDEQRVLHQLSVFRGPFSREAAAEVAGANLSLLSTLVDKSLIHRTGEDRYELHELIRQFAAALLNEDAVAAQATHRRHARYFVAVLQAAETALQGGGQREALAELNRQVDNIRAAWEHAVAHRQLDLMRRAAWPLWYFYELRNTFQEGEALMAAGVDALQARLAAPDLAPGDPERARLQSVLGDLLAHQAFFSMRIGLVVDAVALFETSIGLLRPLDEPAILAHALAHHGLGCWLLGRFETAARSLRDCLPLSDALNHRWQLPLFTAFLGVVVHELGDYEEAYRLLDRAMAGCRTLEDPRLICFTANYLSRTAQVLGRLAAVEPHLYEGLRLAQETRDRFGMGLMLERLAVGAQAAGDLVEARRLFETCVALFREIGDMWSVARALHLLGRLELVQDDLAAAQAHLLESLQTAVVVNLQPATLDALAALAIVQGKAGASERALELATHVRRHPASSRIARDEATRLTTDLGQTLPPCRIEAVEKEAQRRPFDDLVAELLHSEPPPTAAPGTSHAGSTSRGAG